MTHAVEIPHIVSRVAEKMKLPGLNSDVADKATNKLERIQCFKNKKIPSPTFEFADSEDECIAKAKKIGFPLVIKPIDSRGARGVIKVENLNEIRKKYKESILFSTKKTVLIEKYIEGSEISTEAIIINGKIVTTGFADRNYTNKEKFKPYFIEDGHTVPSLLPKKIQKKVIEITESAIKSLGINWGVAKGDVILDGDEPKILEMAARTSGGRFCSDMVPLATGINIIKPLIQMSLGLPIDTSFIEKKYDKGAAQRFFFPGVGKLERIVNLKKAKKIAWSL